MKRHLRLRNYSWICLDMETRNVQVHKYTYVFVLMLHYYQYQMDKQTRYHARACGTMCEVVCCTASSYDNFTCLLPPIRCTRRPSATQTTPTVLRVKWTGWGGAWFRCVDPAHRRSAGGW